jgi:hypothetical protein
MPRRRFPIALGPALLLSLLAALPCARAQESELERTHAAADGIVERGGYQRDLPGFRERSPLDLPGSRRRDGSSTGDDERDGRRVRRETEPLRKPREGGESGSTWGSFDVSDLALPLEIAAGVLFVLLAIWVVLTRRSAARVAAAPTVKPTALAAAGEAPADPLAVLLEQGRFADAVHRLLAGAIERLARVVPLRLARGTTGREIVPRVPAAPGREALRELVLLDERGRFADLPVGASDVERGRELARAAAPEPPP